MLSWRLAHLRILVKSVYIFGELISLDTTQNMIHLQKNKKCMNAQRKQLSTESSKSSSAPTLTLLFPNESVYVRLGDDVQRPYTQMCRTQALDKDPLISFIFKYRPLGAHISFLRLIYIPIWYPDVLRANGIVLSSVGQKRRAVTDPEPEIVKEEANEDEDANTARIKALEVCSRLSGLSETSMTLV
jgi:hypothetical protein